MKRIFQIKNKRKYNIQFTQKIISLDFMEFWVSPYKTHDFNFVFEHAKNSWLVYLLQDLLANNGQVYINTIRNYIWKANDMVRHHAKYFTNISENPHSSHEKNV